jgi:hypothetical protein
MTTQHILLHWSAAYILRSFVLYALYNLKTEQSLKTGYVLILRKIYTVKEQHLFSAF